MVSSSVSLMLTSLQAGRSVPMRDPSRDFSFTFSLVIMGRLSSQSSPGPASPPASVSPVGPVESWRSSASVLTYREIEVSIVVGVESEIMVLLI